jgi:hypothetical protein
MMGIRSNASGKQYHAIINDRKIGKRLPYGTFRTCIFGSAQANLTAKQMTCGFCHGYRDIGIYSITVIGEDGVNIQVTGLLTAIIRRDTALEKITCIFNITQFRLQTACSYAFRNG